MGVGRGVAMLTLMLALGCAEEAEPRGQWLVVVDTNLPTVSQALADERVSFDAAVDTLRIDVIRADGSLHELREVIAMDARDWPISFGVVLDRGTPALLRIRAFSAGFSRVGEALGQTVLEPVPSTTVDRLVELDGPGDAARSVHVLLDAECMGVPPSFSPRATCIDAQRFSADPSDLGSAPSTGASVGSWAPAIESPCEGSPPEGSVCVPGGFSVLGTIDQGLVDGTMLHDDPFPPRPAWVSPFYMDLTEVTVGRLRKLVNDAPAALPGLPRKKGSGLDALCTWLGPSDSTQDERPANCLGIALAEAACAALGGRLPSEAEWEHAARGRGQRRRYPWGNTVPSCCTTVAGGPECGRLEYPPVGEAAKQDCPETDRSRDGVLDLAGSVSELTRDAYSSYEDACWAIPGILRDPVCVEEGLGAVTMRGGNANGPPILLLSATRRPIPRSAEAAHEGFRCVYPGGGTP